MPIPLPRTPDTPSTSHRVGRVSLASGEASASPPDKLAILYHRPVASRSSPFPSKQAARSNSDASKRHCCSIAALLASCYHCTRLQTSCNPIFYQKNDATHHNAQASTALPNTPSSSPITHILNINMASVPSEGSVDRGTEERFIYVYIIFIFIFYLVILLTSPPLLCPSSSP
jgi:hypothetical protein